MGKFNFFYAYNLSGALHSRCYLSLIEIGILYALLHWQCQFSGFAYTETPKIIPASQV